MLIYTLMGRKKWHYYPIQSTLGLIIINQGMIKCETGSGHSPLKGRPPPYFQAASRRGFIGQRQCFPQIQSPCEQAAPHSRYLLQIMFLDFRNVYFVLLVFMFLSHLVVTFSISFPPLGRPSVSEHPPSGPSTR
jgi:hypothetical protein